jgi:hypothetical protein
MGVEVAMQKLVSHIAHCPSFMLLLRLDVEGATLRFVALKADAGISYAQLTGSST